MSIFSLSFKGVLKHEPPLQNRAFEEQVFEYSGTVIVIAEAKQPRDLTLSQDWHLVIVDEM